MLAQEPTHGYELKKRFDGTVGALWPLQQAQIYNNLRLLEKGGLIELDAHIEQTDLPDRKNYRVTTAGEAELRTWLISPTLSGRKLKDEFYLKLTTLAKVMQEPETLTNLLWAQRKSLLQQLRELEQALTTVEAEGDDVTAVLLEGAILHAEADLTWLDQVEDRLHSASQDASQDATQKTNQDTNQEGA